MIGREKDPANSEVRRLIEDSLVQDLRRAEAARERELLLRRQHQHQPPPDDEIYDEVSSDVEEQQQPANDSSPVCHQILVVDLRA